ncbi:MAG: flagellar biosynthetic protein FliQ [Candidatus Eisenbacteria bacterium]|nr:flagellar biosynthetic protein FliQ [Candidatus Eisenbacteria bacterium]
MSGDFAVELVRRAVMLAALVSAPMLVTALAVGILISLVQAVTQIQEQTLTFVPKLLALGAVFLFALPWIIVRLVEYLVTVVNQMGSLAG